MATNLDAALYHVAAGRPVFPCSPIDKKPAIPKRLGGNGFKDATTDPDVVRAWWTQYPDAIPGMPTGARVGVWVLDVDTKPGKVGDETIARLIETFGPLPETVETITATGGRHLFFRHPRDGRLIPNSASKLGHGHETWGRNGYPAVPFELSTAGKLIVPDLDVRGDGGYVILPGALMADGRRYEWEGSSDPDEGATVADPPDWLLALVVQDREGAPVEGAVRSVDVEPVPDGRRNDHLYSLGCSLRAKGLTESVIVATLLAENAERCTPPLPMQEVVATAKSAASKPPGLSPDYEARRAASSGRQAGRGSREHRSDPPTPTRKEAGPPPSAPAGGDEKERHPGASAALQAPPSPGLVQDGPPADWPPDPPGGGPPDDGDRSPSDRPMIQIVEGENPAHADDAERHLIGADVGVYQRGDQGLVRIASFAGVPVSAVRRRSPGACVITEITETWLCDQMTRHISWMRWDSRAEALVRKDAPPKVAKALLARSGDWRFPYLTGFCAAPTMDLEGRVISAPGYDTATGLYLVDPPPLEPIVTTDRYLAERAGERLSELLGISVGPGPEKFPFAQAVDESAALAMVMTAVLRPLLPTAPIMAVSAATPGTGKSLWVDVVSTVASGRPVTVVNMGKDEEETEKRIGAQLMLGETFSFDNIEGAFRSSALCTAATQESMNVRVLSQSRMARVLTRVCIFLTGNNVTPLGDLARRVLLARLDAGCERPELREFSTDALERALANRSEAIRCVMILSKAYLEAGRPRVRAPPTGSFRDWDTMVRFPLIWAGYEDPLGRAEDLREADHSLSGLGLLMMAWRRIRPEACTAADLYELITSTVQTMAGQNEPQYAELHDAAVQIRGDPRKWTPRDLGYVLREAQGRPLGGMRIVPKGKSNRGMLWQVEDVPRG